MVGMDIHQRPDEGICETIEGLIIEGGGYTYKGRVEGGKVP